jgi:putative transposase
MLLGGHAFEFNRRHDRFGHLYAGRYAASGVDSDAYVLELFAYIVLNPVRAGIVAEPGEWTWSSYRFSAGVARTPPFIETRLVPGMLASEPDRARDVYRQLVREIAGRPRPGSG